MSESKIAESQNQQIVENIESESINPQNKSELQTKYNNLLNELYKSDNHYKSDFEVIEKELKEAIKSKEDNNINNIDPKITLNFDNNELNIDNLISKIDSNINENINFKQTSNIAIIESRIKFLNTLKTYLLELKSSNKNDNIMSNETQIIKRLENCLKYQDSKLSNEAIEKELKNKEEEIKAKYDQFHNEIKAKEDILDQDIAINNNDDNRNEKAKYIEKLNETDKSIMELENQLKELTEKRNIKIKESEIEREKLNRLKYEWEIKEKQIIEAHKSDKNVILLLSVLLVILLIFYFLK